MPANQDITVDVRLPGKGGLQRITIERIRGLTMAMLTDADGSTQVGTALNPLYVSGGGGGGGSATEAKQDTQILIEGDTNSQCADISSNTNDISTKIDAGDGLYTGSTNLKLDRLQDRLDANNNDNSTIINRLDTLNTKCTGLAQEITLGTTAREGGGNLDAINTSTAGLVTRTGEVQASPTANTILGRLKDLLTGIVLAAGTAIIGKVGIDQTTPGTTNNVSVTGLIATTETDYLITCTNANTEYSQPCQPRVSDSGLKIRATTTYDSA